ncbi:MAG: hypothetical protein INR62_09930 [Rhodospirillales bacterium]|nr:hypothetical protein [Acetobacter sp.]
MKLTFGPMLAGLTTSLVLPIAAANAASAPYYFNINIPYGSYTITGVLETDGTQGTLARSNISSYDLSVPNYNDVAGSGVNVVITGLEPGLVAKGKSLTFDFGSNVDIRFEEPTGGLFVQLAGVQSDVGSSLTYFNLLTKYDGNTDVVTIGTSPQGDDVVGTVPLPPSAPLFAAAIIGFGVAGICFRATILPKGRAHS